MIIRLNIVVLICMMLFGCKVFKTTQTNATYSRIDYSKIHYPENLSNQIDTIELHYIAWACYCAEWGLEEDIKKYGYDNEDDSLAIMSIFIEAASPDLIIPDKYHLGCCNNKIRFIGSFYKDKGISRTYDIQHYKPDDARVFRYTDYELIKPYTVWYHMDTVGATSYIVEENNIIKVERINKIAKDFLNLEQVPNWEENQKYR